LGSSLDNSTVGLARYAMFGVLLLVVSALASCDSVGSGYASATSLLAQSLKPGMTEAEVLATMQTVNNELRSESAITNTRSNGVKDALPDFNQVGDVVTGNSRSEITQDCARPDHCHPRDLISRMSFTESGESRNGVQVLLFERPTGLNDKVRFFYAIYSFDQRLIGFISLNQPITSPTRFD
jgi:hypothetical protein